MSLKRWGFRLRQRFDGLVLANRRLQPLGHLSEALQPCTLMREKQFTNNSNDQGRVETENPCMQPQCRANVGDRFFVFCDLDRRRARFLVEHVGGSQRVVELFHHHRHAKNISIRSTAYNQASQWRQALVLRHDQVNEIAGLRNASTICAPVMAISIAAPSRARFAFCAVRASATKSASVSPLTSRG